MCRYIARTRWLQEQLSLTDLPKHSCTEYENVLKRVDPRSATLVFPAAHINSPASMFGHTFIRINSSYNSRLLSHAINYAADANPDTENAIIFSIKGLFGGYFGTYSLLPYYEKLKEYRDTESRDIWEYHLNLTQDETLRMLEHIWELKESRSYYYFFTENCSYNMLWLLELARPTLRLRDSFAYQIIPLETVHAAKAESLIQSAHYRPSRRSKLLHYERLLAKEFAHYLFDLVEKRITPQEVAANPIIPLEQKRYILEATIEYLEYSFSRNDLTKEEHIGLVYAIAQNPVDGHQSIRAFAGLGFLEGSSVQYLGIRPAYHDLFESNYGFLRGTQIEFMNLVLKHHDKEYALDEATIISIVSLSERSLFINNISWKAKIGCDSDYLGHKALFNATFGAGVCYSNDYGYIYATIDPLLYHVESAPLGGIALTGGLALDGYRSHSTNIELSSRYFENEKSQLILRSSQNFRTSQNTLLQIQYNRHEDNDKGHQSKRNELRFKFNYYF